MKDVSETTHFESLYPEDARKKETDALISVIKKGGSAQLIGLPGVGRSNLLRFLTYNNQARVFHLTQDYKWFHFVYMDISEMKGRSQSELLKFILISLSYSFSERKMQEETDAVNSFLKEAVSLDDALILFQAVKKAIDYLCIEKELTVILLFDRFDSYIPELTTSFFTDLRILRNRAKYRFSCVFSLERSLEETLEESFYAEFYEFMVGNSIYLSLEDSVANNFRLSYLEKVSGKTLSETQKTQLIKLSGGHGKLLRVSAEAILAEGKTPENMPAFLLGKKSVESVLFEIWNALTPVEQKEIRTNPESFNGESYVVLAGLVKNGTIQIPLFVDMLPMFPKPATEKIIYMPETNEIQQGEEALSEKLSPSEFRLLRFLIQNKDRVCEKEEIIASVWNDAKTQEGVTDQALDQIIYRVRKKIEEDPNNPVHIHTIKGRGYKFS